MNRPPDTDGGETPEGNAAAVVLGAGVRFSRRRQEYETMNTDKMNGKIMRFSFEGTVCLVDGLCASVSEYRKYAAEGPMGRDERYFRELLEEQVSRLLERYGEEENPETRVKALLAVMDAYEITANEEQLQAALGHAERILPELQDGPQKCKLLTYCYYYVEDPACAEEARRILESWEGMRHDAEMQDAERCFAELV